MTNLIALDLSLTATGYFDGVRSETWKPKVKGHERLDFILRALQLSLMMREPEAVIIEGFSFGSQGRSVYEIGGLGYLVRHTLWNRGIPYCEVPPTVLKRFSTGKGNSGKDEMIAAAIRRFGFEGSDNNEADAFMLWHLGQALHGQATIPLPKAHEVDADKVRWVRP